MTRSAAAVAGPIGFVVSGSSPRGFTSTVIMPRVQIGDVPAAPVLLAVELFPASSALLALAAAAKTMTSNRSGASFSTWLINCHCGQTVRGESDDQLVANAEEHMREKPPEMVGTKSREEILAMAHDA